MIRLYSGPASDDRSLYLSAFWPQLPPTYAPIGRVCVDHLIITMVSVPRLMAPGPS